MDINTKMEINNLVEDITQDGDTFPASSARRLIDLVPRQKVPKITVYRNSRSSGNHETGLLTNIGELSFKEDDNSTEASQINGPEPFRAGGYKIFHSSGRMMISQLFAETAECRDGRDVLLSYGERNAPISLGLSFQKDTVIYIPTIRVLLNPFNKANYNTERIRRVFFEPWKTPDFDN